MSDITYQVKGSSEKIRVRYDPWRFLRIGIVALPAIVGVSLPAFIRF